MSWFNDYRSHYFLGRVYGLTLLTRTLAAATRAILDLDRWAHAREREQSRQDPDSPLSEHKLREAMAWGAGARASSGVKVAYPSPPYPEGARWTSV